jgi:ParB family transcriptional regulator, chromosome partitioning protein
MNRKDTLKALLGSSIPAAGKETPRKGDDRDVNQPQQRVGAGAVRAMGLSLQKLTAEVDQARALQTQIEAGSSVVELDPDLVDPSFVIDRLSPTDDDSFLELVQSIEANGQQVPILVRPHPDQSGRYQVAYGHRRLRAATTLKIKVRAIVRDMTNVQLVIAQGKENLERRDLTFIERALFAKALEDEGFDRATVMAALVVHKAELTRFIAVARSIPLEVIQAIGPAPRAGRPRWMALARLLEGKNAARTLERVVAEPVFKAADSDTRFVRVYAALNRAPSKSNSTDLWRAPGGKPVVKIGRSTSVTRLEVDEKVAPEFGAFLIEKLSALYEEFLSSPDGRLAQSDSDARRS